MNYSNVQGDAPKPCESRPELFQPTSLSGTVSLHLRLYFLCMFWHSVVYLWCNLCLKGPLNLVPACLFIKMHTVAAYFLLEVYVSWLYQSNWLLSFPWIAHLCSTCYWKEQKDKLRISDIPPHDNLLDLMPGRYYRHMWKYLCLYQCIINDSLQDIQGVSPQLFLNIIMPKQA